MDNERILVSVITLAYNHKQYICECIEGILMQKTSFEFELIIHDDASTDGTADIIRDYESRFPNIIKPIYQTENQYSKGFKQASAYINSQVKGKYIAFCEGDDYWTDPMKLQRQVDFLESHPDYGLVHTDYCFLDNETGKIRHHASRRYKIVDGYAFEALFRGCYIKTLTVCCRTNLIENLPELSSNTFDGDIFLFFEISKHSKIYFDNSESGVYRILPSSASHHTNWTSWKIFNDKLKNLDYYYLDQYPNLVKVRRLVDRKWFLSDLKYYIRIGDKKAFATLNFVPKDTKKKLDPYQIILFLGKNIILFNIIHIVFSLRLWVLKKYHKAFI